MNDLISVIIPAYKVESYLNRCVDSVLAQTYKKIEVILVDDGSPDRCGLICDGYNKKDNRIRVFHQENGGVSSARNKGLSEAKGKLISFVDADDFIEPDFISYLYNKLIFENADIASCNFYECHGTSKRINSSNNTDYIINNKEGIVRCINHTRMYANVWNRLYKKDILFDVLFDENMFTSEDHLFNFCEYINSKLSIHSGVPKYHYDKNRENSVTRSRDRLNTNRLYMVEQMKKAINKRRLNDKEIIQHIEAREVMEHAALLIAAVKIGRSKIDQNKLDIIHENLFALKDRILINKKLSLKFKAVLLLNLINRNMLFALLNFYLDIKNLIKSLILRRNGFG